MNVSAALYRRHATRAYLDRDIEPDKIKRILTTAGRSPSGANTQPWRVAVVSGRRKSTITQRIADEFSAGNPGKADFQYYAKQWIEPYRTRRFACGMQLYTAVGVERHDKVRRVAQWAENFRAFGAPVMMFFHMESHLQAGSFLDFGMFIQSVMLLAVEAGLATCPQAALGEYPHIVKQELELPANTILLCGMALGYEDTGAAVNQYRTPRQDLDDFVSFYSE